MGIDELELLGLRHRVGDDSSTGEELGGAPERAGRSQAGQESRRALEERRHGIGEGFSRRAVELGKDQG